MKRVFPSLALFLLFASFENAQTYRGGINGIVTDQSAAFVPGADVKATSETTRLAYTTSSSGAGEFSFQDLPLGTYTILVSARGFQTVKVDGVRVSAGTIYTLPVRLSLAQVSSTVEVNAAALALDTSATTLLTVVTSDTVENRPLNGRDFVQMIAVSPSFSGYAAGAIGSVNGARANQVNWQIDGTDNNDQWWNIMAVNQGGIQSIPGVLMPLDSVDEFSLQTQAGPETGRNPGGTINLVIKSGTNQLHGSLYYYNRNEFFSARAPFQPVGSPKNKLRNQHYGFSAGFPIIKDKTFLFASYEEQKFVIGTQAITTEPSLPYQAAARQLLQQYGVAENPVADNLLATIWPADALLGPASPNNYFNPTPETGFSHNGLVKLDHSFNDSNRLSFRYFVGQGTQVAPVGSHLLYYYQVGPMHVQNYSLTYNKIFSSRLTNQALVGVSYFNQVFSDLNHSFNPVTLGLNTGVNATNLAGAPLISITGFENTGLTPNSGRNDITGHFADALSYTTGKHQMRFGGEVRQARIDSFYTTGGRGAFYFSGTQGPWSALLNDPTFDTNIATLADFMAGYVYQSTIMRGNQERKVLMNSFNLFAQDAWQATRALNLNFGLRYEYQGPLHDGRQDLSTFDPARGGLAVVGQKIGDLYPRYWKNISPRLGFAYQPRGAHGLVVRGGFGLFFDTPAIVPFLDNSSSLAAASVANNGPLGVEANPAGTNPVFLLQQNGYTIMPNQPIFPAGSTSISGNNVVNLFSASQNFRPAYDLSYNLNLEKSLGGNVMLQLGYVGAQGRRLLSLVDINQAALGSGFVNTTNAAGFPFQQTTRPYFAQYPNFGVIDEIQSIGTSNFNSLQVQVKTKSWHGLTSQASYAWGHSLDEVTQYVGALPQDSTNFKGDYGNSDYDVRHHMNAFLLYDVPGSSHGPAWLTHGWQFNSNFTYRTGFPFTIHATSDTSGTGENTTRGVQIGNPFQGVSHAFSTGNPVQWINPNAYTNPGNGSFGSVARNSVHAPGFGDIDLSVLKNIPITERLKAQFRVEIFNLLNRVNLAPPNGFIGGGFGQSSDTAGDFYGSPGIGPGEPFNVQLALKILF
jgi:Carboxypeptidase regulatory-like domain